MFTFTFKKANAGEMLPFFFVLVYGLGHIKTKKNKKNKKNKKKYLIFPTPQYIFSIGQNPKYKKIKKKIKKKYQKLKKHTASYKLIKTNNNHY